MVSLIQDWIARCESGRMASSRKCDPGWSGPGYGHVIEGLDSDLLGFGRGCQFQEMWSGWSGSGAGRFDKVLNGEICAPWKDC